MKTKTVTGIGFLQRWQKLNYDDDGERYNWLVSCSSLLVINIDGDIDSGGVGDDDDGDGNGGDY